MYVCICNMVSDKQIRKAVEEGATTFQALQEQLCVSTCCGCCEPEVREIIEECRVRSTNANVNHEHLPLRYHAA